MKQQLIEGAKEALRLLIFSIPGILLVVASHNPTWGNTALGGSILILLRAVDKSIHDNPATTSKGLLPF